MIARFMATPVGRGMRIALGIALAVAGLLVGGSAGWVLVVVAVVPILAGLANVCLIAPIIGAPFRGGDALKG